MQQSLEKIKKDHPKVNLDPIKDVANKITTKFDSKKEITVTSIAKILKYPRSKIARIFDTLEEYKFIKRSGSGTASPYLVTTDIESEKKFHYGTEIFDIKDDNFNKLDKEIPSNKKINQKDFTEIREYSKLEKKGKFYKLYNESVEKLWKYNNSLVKIEMGSKAIRYKLFDSS